MKTEVVDEYGLCILRDAAAACPEGSGLGKEFQKAPLKAAALGGSIFFIDREDPTRLKAVFDASIATVEITLAPTIFLIAISLTPTHLLH